MAEAFPRVQAYELVESHALGFRRPTRFAQKRWGYAQRKITPSHFGEAQAGEPLFQSILIATRADVELLPQSPSPKPALPDRDLARKFRERLLAIWPRSKPEVPRCGRE